MKDPKVHARRGYCGGPMSKGDGTVARGSGYAVHGYVALHKGAVGSVGTDEYDCCPVYMCNPDVHPLISDSLVHYARWKRFGYDAIPKSEKLIEALTILDVEFEALRSYMSERDRKR